MSNRTEYTVTRGSDGKYTTKHGSKTFTGATLRALDNSMTKAKVPLNRTFRVVETKA